MKVQKYLGRTVIGEDTANKKHEKLREILQKYGCNEYGDCIVDDISYLFDFPTTVDVSGEY